MAKQAAQLYEHIKAFLQYWWSALDIEKVSNLGASTIVQQLIYHVIMKDVIGRLNTAGLFWRYRFEGNIRNLVLSPILTMVNQLWPIV